MALLQLKEERLYRSTHFSFDEFCQEVFGYGSNYAYLKMSAAKVYKNLIDLLPSSLVTPTNVRRGILPTRQRQLRPIVKAKLNVDAQVEVWQMAIALANGKIPSNSMVSEAVNLYLTEHDTQINSFTEGEVCQIIARGNNQLRGKGGNWCIVEEVQDSSCIVNTWNERLSIHRSNLESKAFDRNEYRAIEDIGVRMTKLHQTGKLDQAALWILNGLAKLNRPNLTPLKEKLLQVLEDFYIFHDVE